MKSAKPTFTQTLQRALQLDFFNELFGNASEPLAEQKPAPALPPKSDDNEPKLRLRQILLQDQVLEYSLRRSTRRSVGFLIADEGLRITAPRWVTIADIEQAIREKQNWIISKLREKRERIVQRQQAQMRWEDGATFPYLGISLTLRIVASSKTAMVHDTSQNSLTAYLPTHTTEEQIKERLQLWLKQEAKRIFTTRLPIYAEKLGVTYQSLSLSSAATRWGSCTSQGKIRLNWRLIHFSAEVIDYVIAHELAHRREMNHSPAFWATVASVFPDYQQAKQVLRNHAAANLPTL